MANLFGRGRRQLLTTLSVIAVSMVHGFGHTRSGGEVEFESHLLPAAEEKLARGESAEALALYQRALADAGGFEERLALIGPLARAIVLSENSEFLLTEMDNGEGIWEEPWEGAVFRGAVFQFLQDFAAAGEELAGVSRQEIPPEWSGLFRQQKEIWAIEVGDLALILPLAREAFAAEPSMENHQSYVRALVQAGAEEELLVHLTGRLSEVSAEAGFWRSLLPELRQQGMLDSVSVYLEEGWKRGTPDVAVLFSLAELKVFQDRTEEAVDLFWTIFEMEEAEGPGDSRRYFQRLNHFFHNRYAVKNRLGLATGKYGTEMCREFSFLGLRPDVSITDVGSARDAALLYLRELIVPAGSSGDFLERLRVGLDRAERPPAQRILAFAGVGAAVYMVEEVTTFVESATKDTAAAEFSLLALNRFVLSTEKFPELRESLRYLALAMEGKFSGERTVEARRRNEQMQVQISRRLGFGDPEVQKSGADDGGREDLLEGIVRAVEGGDSSEAVRLYSELILLAGDNEYRRVLLFLARGWQAQGEHEEAASLVREFLEPVYVDLGPGQVPGPLEWPESGGFLPTSPYSEADLEAMQEAFDIIVRTPTWPVLLDTLIVQDKGLSEATLAGGIALQMYFHAWAGEVEEAIAAGRSGVNFVGDSEVQLLLAHLFGMQRRFGEGQEVIDELASKATAVGKRARRLLFAFAVADRDRDRAGALAGAFVSSPLLAGEKLQVATGLMAVDLGVEAAEWMEWIDLAELDTRETEIYQLIQMKVAMSRQDHKLAAGLARFALLEEMPLSFYTLLTPLRLEALEVLRRSGQLDDYQRQLRELLNLAPASLSLHFLLGESADYRWRKMPLEEERDSAKDREEAVWAFSQTPELRPGLIDLQLDLCEWLARAGQWKEATEQYQKLLQVDAQSALMDLQTLFEVYRRADRLPAIIDFLEAWKIPEAPSMDDFYGLQPTAHIFQALGDALSATGEDEAAVRARKKGLEINPVAFTEIIRLALAEFYLEGGDRGEVLDLLRSYVSQANLDPHLYAVQPFASVYPRWVAVLAGSSDRSSSPVERLISMAVNEGREKELRAVAEEWRDEMPGQISLALFCVYLSARAGEPGWREELLALGEPYRALDFSDLD